MDLGSPPRSPQLSESHLSPDSVASSDRPDLSISESVPSQSESVLSISEPEYFLFHSGFSGDEDNDVCLLKIRSGDKIIFIRYSFTLLCSPRHFEKLHTITNLNPDELQEILYKTTDGNVERMMVTEDLCTTIDRATLVSLTVDDINGLQSLNDYDEAGSSIQRSSLQRALFEDSMGSVESLASRISARPAQSTRPLLPLVPSMKAVRISGLLSDEVNDLTGFIVDMYGLPRAIQVSLGTLHNSLNMLLASDEAPQSFTDVVCASMSTFCDVSVGPATTSRSFDEWMNGSEPAKKAKLMWLKSAYVAFAENACKVHDKPETEIVKKMHNVTTKLSRTLQLRGCSNDPDVDRMLSDMDVVFVKHFGSYVTASKIGGVSQEKCRLAITDYQSCFNAAMDKLGCPIPSYGRLGDIARIRTSRAEKSTETIEKRTETINLGFDAQPREEEEEEEDNIASLMVANGQALVCDAINHRDFSNIPYVAHLNSSEIDAARLSLKNLDEKPSVLLIESPMYEDNNTRTQITPIACNFTSAPPPRFQHTEPCELHEGDGGLFVFLSIPWAEPASYNTEWFQNLSPDDKSKVIRPIICVYKITDSFPHEEGYDEATQRLCGEFNASLRAEFDSLRRPSNLRVPTIRPTIQRLGIRYSFVFGITTTRGGVSNNLTLALMLPHLAQGRGAKCFRGTCDAGSCKLLLENSECVYLKPEHFAGAQAPLSLTELNFLLGLNLKEYGDGTKAECAAKMMSLYKILTVLASVDWCLLLRQFERVAAFRADTVYKILGTTKLKPLDHDEIRKIATLQALFMCYPHKDELLNATALKQHLLTLSAPAVIAQETKKSYALFKTHVTAKINERVIHKITDSLARFHTHATVDVLPDYCGFVLFHKKLMSTDFLVEEDRFIELMSKPVTSHGRHVCHGMLDFFDKYVIDTRKIDSFDYERMRLMKVKEPGATAKLLEQMSKAPAQNPVVKKLLASGGEANKAAITKQAGSDLVGVFSNCNLFELLLLVAHYSKNPGYILPFEIDGLKAGSGRQHTLAPIESFNANKVKELLRPSLWSVFHEFFGAECGISDYSSDHDLLKIKALLIGQDFAYLSPDDIVSMKEPKIPPPAAAVATEPVRRPSQQPLAAPERPGAGLGADAVFARTNALNELKRRQAAAAAAAAAQQPGNNTLKRDVYFAAGPASPPPAPAAMSFPPPPGKGRNKHRKGGSRNNTKRTKKYKRTPNKQNKTIRNKLKTKSSLRNTIKRRKTKRRNNSRRRNQ